LHEKCVDFEVDDARSWPEITGKAVPDEDLRSLHVNG